MTPSRWLQSIAKESLIGSFSIIHIPNGIDTREFRPVDQIAARRELGLPTEKRLIMFGAQDLSDPRKGGDLLMKALETLPETLKRECLLLLVGSKGEAAKTIAGVDAASLGYFMDSERMALAYSAADVFVLPTRNDNLPLVIQESLACGTPVVSFAVGGVPELVIPQETGYLAQPGDCVDLASGIEKVLQHSKKGSDLRMRCREIAVQQFDIGLMVKRYRDLYVTLIDEQKSNSA